MNRARVTSRPPASIRTRLAVALGAGLIGPVLGGEVGPAEGALIGLAIAGVLFVASGWIELWRLTPEETRTYAGREDAGRRVDGAIVVGIALASLGGIGAFLATAGSSADTWAAAVAVLDVAMAWASLHLMFAGRYAKLFYTSDQPDPIDFSGPPAFSDFLYFSYNLGMTYQVSDTSVTSSDIRRVVLFHCLLSYVFGTAILATTINLVLGALTG